MNNGSKEFLSQIFNGTAIITIMIIAFLIMVGILIIMAHRIKKKNQSDTDSHSKGHFISKGIATFMPLGFAVSIPIGIATKNIFAAVALGPVLGLILGMLIGTSKEKKHEKSLRPLNPDEIKLKKTAQLMLTFLIALGFVLYYITYFILI
jgi:hypothetical protein